MGGPVRSGGEALRSLEEAIEIIRRFWSSERSISFAGEHYSVKGLHPGPPPVHEMGIWLGVGKPKALALTGRLADGWVLSLSLTTPDLVPDMQRRIDEAATAAGRDPSEIRRVLNVKGRIADGPVGELVEGPPEHWVDTVSGLAADLGFDTFVLWPTESPVEQLERFAREVVPALRR
jgi:alkanesulfonate monooxygenase SsuD/methylene tetrahydromethanopterin reductase-like flavin-dependent oxidoreductase (luciferase family)